MMNEFTEFPSNAYILRREPVFVDDSAGSSCAKTRTLSADHFRSLPTIKYLYMGSYSQIE